MCEVVVSFSICMNVSVWSSVIFSFFFVAGFWGVCERVNSNFPFLSKLLKRIILLQLSDHLLTNNLLCPNQTACRAGHGTETTFLKIVMCGLFCLCYCAQAVCEMVVTCSLCIIVSVWSSIVCFVFAARIRLCVRWQIPVVFAWLGQCGQLWFCLCS